MRLPPRPRGSCTSAAAHLSQGWEDHHGAAERVSDCREADWRIQSSNSRLPCIRPSSSLVSFTAD
eukprot:scaffold42266_cov60-Phaeocystis_antarctica.AAC.1